MTNMIQQDINDILETISFVDKIIFGRLHYNKQISAYKDHKQYYNELAQQVIDFCKSKGINYHIKSKTITE